jgi:hypothetical protein
LSRSSPTDRRSCPGGREGKRARAGRVLRRHRWLQRHTGQMIDPLELPSFSRLGKSTCNAKDRGALEDHRRRAEKDALRTRAPATFRPITEIAPPSSGYDQDRGRSEPITSSPRQVDEADDTEEELQVRRVVRFPGSNAAQDKAKGQTGTGNGRDSLTSSARGDREHQLVPKKVASLQLHACSAVQLLKFPGTGSSAALVHLQCHCTWQGCDGRL